MNRFNIRGSLDKGFRFVLDGPKLPKYASSSLFA
jgi:hypothetical protein